MAISCGPQEAYKKLAAGNKKYLRSCSNPACVSPALRQDTAQNGQKPYAVVLTCSDSRVPPEHIFSAGIGELFVVRTAGNVVGGFELGSIEYAVEHLHAPLILIMGHSGCGAVAAALGGHAHGHIEEIVREIQLGLDGAEDECSAVYNNIMHSRQRVMASAVVEAHVRAGKTAIVCAKYNISSGAVEFFDTI